MMYYLYWRVEYKVCLQNTGPRLLQLVRWTKIVVHLGVSRDLKTNGKLVKEVKEGNVSVRLAFMFQEAVQKRHS